MSSYIKTELDWGTVNHMLLILRDDIEDIQLISKSIEHDYPSCSSRLDKHEKTLTSIRNYILKEQEKTDNRLENSLNKDQSERKIESNLKYIIEKEIERIDRQHKEYEKYGREHWAFGGCSDCEDVKPRLEELLSNAISIKK